MVVVVIHAKNLSVGIRKPDDARRYTHTQYSIEKNKRMIEKKKRMTCIPNRMWAISFSGRAAQVGIRNSPQHKTNFNKAKNSEVDIFLCILILAVSLPIGLFFLFLSIDSTTWCLFHMCTSSSSYRIYTGCMDLSPISGTWPPTKVWIFGAGSRWFHAWLILFLSSAIQHPHPHENDISNQILCHPVSSWNKEEKGRRPPYTWRLNGEVICRLRFTSVKTTSRLNSSNMTITWVTTTQRFRFLPFFALDVSPLVVAKFKVARLH